MAGADIDKVLALSKQKMDEAADSDNSLDQTTYYVGAANHVILSGILLELKAIREALERKT